MDPEETMDVAPSEDNGNVPADAPSEQAPKAEPVTEETTPATEPVAPTETELYELPDGRKVDAETLSKEWKENFYPDYTRKSQALAEKAKAETLPNDNKPTDPYKDPEWRPQSYAELLEVATANAVKEIENKQDKQQQEIKAIETAVSDQLEAVKKLDPNVNENALFMHATKYGFRDLTIAHQNMKDMNQLVKTVQKTTADNITKRVDPVSITPGATGNKPDPSQFDSAVDYLRALKASQ